jgi:shikimate dehydrogenase
LRGTNTDAFGFVEALRARVPSWSSSMPSVVIGAGGASRAVMVALQDLGATEIRVVNRTQARAVALVEELGPPLRALPWSEREDALDGAGLVVNTTTLGMVGGPPLELRLDALPVQAVVYDIVYVPLTTPLLAAASARGNTAVDGLEMLLHQARPGFSAWFDGQAEVTDDLRAFMRQDLEA